jgi:hypothetical protein
MITASEKGALIREYEEALAAMNLNNFSVLSWPWASSSPAVYERARRCADAVRVARAKLADAGLLPSV